MTKKKKRKKSLPQRNPPNFQIRSNFKLKTKIKKSSSPVRHNVPPEIVDCAKDGHLWFMCKSYSASSYKVVCRLGSEYLQRNIHLRVGKIGFETTLMNSFSIANSQKPALCKSFSHMRARCYKRRYEPECFEVYTALLCIIFNLYSNQKARQDKIGINNLNVLLRPPANLYK